MLPHTCAYETSHHKVLRGEREKVPSVRKQRFKVDPVSIILNAGPQFRTAFKVHCTKLGVEVSAFICAAILV